jgi:hypothetical protein
MGVGASANGSVHWSVGSQWIGDFYEMGTTTRTDWLLRRIARGRAHHDTRGPTLLGLAGAPLVLVLTHSTSGAVTGSNVRLGTSKDLSAGHETCLRRFGGDDNTQQVPPASAQITTVHVRDPNITTGYRNRRTISKEQLRGRLWGKCVQKAADDFRHEVHLRHAVRRIESDTAVIKTREHSTDTEYERQKFARASENSAL